MKGDDKSAGINCNGSNDGQESRGQQWWQRRGNAWHRQHLKWWTMDGGMSLIDDGHHTTIN